MRARLAGPGLRAGPALPRARGQRDPRAPPRRHRRAAPVPRRRGAARPRRPASTGASAARSRDRDAVHYETLGVAADASAAEIRDAYRRLARLHHPDQARPTPRRWRRSTRPTGSSASPARRAVYDAALRGTGSAAGAVVADGGAPSDGAAAPVVDATPARIPWKLMLGMAAVGVAVVLVGAALYEPAGPARPDNLLEPGSCVVIEANGDAREITCTGRRRARRRGARADRRALPDRHRRPPRPPGSRPGLRDVGTRERRVRDAAAPAPSVDAATAAAAAGVTAAAAAVHTARRRAGAAGAGRARRRRRGWPPPRSCAASSGSSCSCCSCVPVVALVLGLVAASRAKRRRARAAGSVGRGPGGSSGLIGVVAFAGFVIAAARRGLRRRCPSRPRGRATASTAPTTPTSTTRSRSCRERTATSPTTPRCSSSTTSRWTATSTPATSAVSGEVEAVCVGDGVRGLRRRPATAQRPRRLLPCSRPRSPGTWAIARVVCLAVTADGSPLTDRSRGAATDAGTLRAPERAFSSVG